MKICILYAGYIDKQIIEDIKSIFPNTECYMVKSKFNLFKKNSYRPAMIKIIESPKELSDNFDIKKFDIVIEQIDSISMNISSSIIKELETDGIEYIKFKVNDIASKNPNVLELNNLLAYLNSLHF